MKRRKKLLRQDIPVLETAPETGLTHGQANERAEKGWSNGQSISAGKTEWDIVTQNLFTFFNLVFVVLAVALALASSSVKNMTFLIVVVCNLCIGCYQEIRAKRAVDKLTLVAAQKIRTIRDGNVEILPSDELVRDDIAEFVAGDQICADAVVLTGQLQVNEALITGEEDAVTKLPGDSLLSGSFVISGTARVRLTGVGADAFAAKLAQEARQDPRAAKSEMMRSLDKLIRWVGIALIPVGLLLFYHEFFSLKQGLTASTEATVAALVGMIPEGLYLLTSIAMAASSLKLTRDKVLVKDLNCIEALARVDVLCVDKTGTITEPGMEVEQVVPLTADPPERLEDILAALYSGTDPENDTARAMIEMFAGKTDWVCEKRIPFTSENKWSAAIFRGQGAFVVGAPEFVMKERYGEIREAVEEWSGKGSRVLLIAAHAGTLSEHLESGKLRPLALVVLSNKIRASAPQTFAYFKEQGVTVKVISGDNPLTVSQVALRAGIEGAENYVDASTLETEADIANAAATCTVFGRVTPDKKKALLRALKAQRCAGAEGSGLLHRHGLRVTGRQSGGSAGADGVGFCRHAGHRGRGSPGDQQHPALRIAVPCEKYSVHGSGTGLPDCRLSVPLCAPAFDPDLRADHWFPVLLSGYGAQLRTGQRQIPAHCFGQSPARRPCRPGDGSACPADSGAAWRKRAADFYSLCRHYRHGGHVRSAADLQTL